MNAPLASPKRAAREQRSFAEDLGIYLEWELDAALRLSWPSSRYEHDPVAFFREILGVEPWEKQIEIIEAIRDHRRVAVRSGHKVSKSHTAGGAGLWFFCTFPDARVVMTSTTARQVNQILWREVRMMRSRCGVCVSCKLENQDRPPTQQIKAPCPHSAIIPEEPGELAATGIKSDDFREIVGFTAKDSEAVAGISGRNLMYIVDEASGVPQNVFEAIEGNRAGGARIVLFSNPTRTEGEHFDAFHSKKEFYHTITVSSEETPNVRAGKILIEGLATAEWIEEKRAEWGEDSPLYKVRVKGEHVLNEDGKIFSIHAISESEKRWPETPEAGRLYIGLDPAGATGTGDETCFTPRRGLKAFEQTIKRGLSEDAILVNLLALINQHKLPRETPVVVFDREGKIGSSLYGLLQSYVERNPNALELVAIRASDRAHRNPEVYDRQRDALAGNLEAWFRDGGAIPEDAKLAQELHILEWKPGMNGRLKVTPKDKIRKLIKRSPDRYDSLALSTWEPLSLQEDVPETAKAAADEVDEYNPASGFDPYAGSDWGRG